MTTLRIIQCCQRWRLVATADGAPMVVRGHMASAGARAIGVLEAEPPAESRGRAPVVGPPEAESILAFGRQKKTSNLLTSVYFSNSFCNITAQIIAKTQPVYSLV